jgi:hypothetical protein
LLKQKLAYLRYDESGLDRDRQAKVRLFEGKAGDASDAIVAVRAPKGNPLLLDCAKTVSEVYLFQPRSLLFERKQIPRLL